MSSAEDNILTMEIESWKEFEYALSPYNPTYKIESLCLTCRTYEDGDRLLGGYPLKKTRIQ